MTQHPSFSIIIPTYRRPKQLVVCLQSLVFLDYPRNRFEVIVVDDGSEISMETVVAPFLKQINLSLLRQTNAGPAAARNTGAKQAKGEFLAFTDDDCTPATDWLTALAKHFLKTPARIIGGKIINKLKNNLYAATSQLILDIAYQHYNANPHQAQFFSSNNMAVPARIFSDIGRFMPNFRTSEDRELCNRWLSNGYQMTYAPEAIIYHANNLNLFGFCKQHFNYGRGAHRFHKICNLRGSSNMPIEVKFHANLNNWLLIPFTQVKLERPFTLMFLLMVWQVINGLGFLREAMKRNTNAQEIKFENVKGG